MEFEFDIEKNDKNIAKHGFKMESALLLFSGNHSVIIDNRDTYGEIRKIAYGYIEGRECVCVYTDRENSRRIISLRKANKREINEYY